MVTDEILATLEKAPVLLKDLIDSIPREMLKQHRIKGKWCIHEHACHIVNAQPLQTGRLKRFINEDAPVFEKYIPGTTTPPDELMNMDLEKSLAAFPRLRSEFVELYRSLTPVEWHKRAEHPQYTDYNPCIMARHSMLHDQTHMYRIEELWLQKEF